MGGMISSGEHDKKDMPYPASQRAFLRCTIDPLCLGMFGATIAFWLVLSFEAFTSNHTPMMLLTGQDYAGDHCGTGAYKDMDYVYYTLNPNSPCLVWDGLPILKSDGTAGTEEWMATDQTEHATCKTLINLGTGNPVDKIESLLDDQDVNFRKVCVTECPDFAADGNTANIAAGGLLNPNYNNVETFPPRYFDPLINGTTYPSAWTNQSTSWKALPEAICPYGADFCSSPWNDKVTVEVQNSYFCVPSAGHQYAVDVSTGAMTEEAAKLALTSSLDGFSDDIEAGFKDFVADCVKSWPMFLYVFGIAVVIGLAWMIVLRFSLDIWIWVGIITFGLLLGVGGFAMMFKAGECYDPVVGEVDTVTQIQNTASEGAGALATSAGNNIDQAWNGCPAGQLYVMSDNTLRQIVLYGACVVWGFGGLYLLCILCSCKAIYMGIKVTKCAARFVFHNRMILLVPIIQIGCLAIVMSAWIVCQMFLFVDPAVPVVLVDADATDRTLAVYKCQESGQTAYCAEVTPFISQTAAPGRDIGNDCIWACAPPTVSMASWKFWWGIFAGFWILCMIVATCQMIIAFACAFWFFKKDQGCGTGFWWTMRYHLGTLAFGSVIVAALKTFRAWISYQQAMVKATTGGGDSPAAKVTEILCCAGQCCLWCIEKCIKFLNKNAYIYVALKGEAFCTAAKNVFQLIVSNVRRVAWLSMISGMVVMLSVAAITAGVVVCGYFLLMALYPPVSEDMSDEDKKTAVSGAIGPCIVYGVIGYIVAKLYMTVYGMATSTILVCAIEAETLDIKCTQFDDDEKLQEIYEQAKEDSKPTKGGADIQDYEEPQ